MPTGCDACVQRTLSRDRVPPGNTADLVLRFTPEGPMQAVALLKTNDPQRPVLRLTASVKARPFAAIDPACVHVGALDAQARTSVIVHIRPASGVSVRRLQARSDGSCVQPHVETARDGVIPVKLTIQPRGKHGRLSERVTFIADLPGNPSISLQVLGEVR